MIFAVLLPVTGMAGAPFATAVPAHLAIFRIGGDLLPVVVGAASSLTLSPTADGLAWLELRWLENLLAVATAPFTHTGVFASGYADLETAVECVPRPRQWLNHKTGRNAGVSHWRRQVPPRHSRPMSRRSDSHAGECGIFHSGEVIIHRCHSFSIARRSIKKSCAQI